MQFTGERLTTEMFDGNAIRHLHRYASTFCLIKGKRVVDIACGEGYGANLMADFAISVYGIDISEETISHARKKYDKHNLIFSLGSVENIPIKTASIDVIVSFETLEHHKKHNEMFAEIKRILSHDGFLIISSPDKYNNTIKTGINNPYHVKELFYEEFEKLANQYFKNIVMARQKEVYGSLIIPEKINNEYVEYSGNYSKIEIRKEPKDFSFNICIASDTHVPLLPASYYDAYSLFQKFEKDLLSSQNSLNSIYSSRTYKFKRFIQKPLNLIRKIFS